jgi:hypothetical protein
MEQKTRASLKRAAAWIIEKPALTAALWFIALYWAQTIQSNLNIGVRHILPTFPFVFLLVGRGLAAWLGVPRPSLSILKYAFAAILLLWMAGAASAAFPHYLPYFNELVGTDNGYRLVVDSNYDWGQDLKRLARFVQERNVERIKVYYFGGSPVEYYLGGRYEFWDPARGPATGWIAVSATLLEGGRGKPAPGFNDPTGYFNWLDNYEPVARAGKSILIYHIPSEIK